MSWYAGGGRGVEIDGAAVPMDELVDAWKRRSDNDRLTRERDKAVKDASDARREAADMRDAMRQARAAVERVVEQRDQAVRERDGAVRERDGYRDALRRERESNVGQPAERLRESIEELERDGKAFVKRMWVVSRTTTVQPGEYGDVFVWSHDADGAVWEVLHGGYSHSQPLYGYTDRAHIAVRALDSIFTDDDDDQIVLAETAR